MHINRLTTLWLLAVMAQAWTITPVAYAQTNPMILVNTESFQMIDDTDQSSDLYVRFGDDLNRRLTFERLQDRFNFNDDVYISGNISTSGTASGSQLYAQHRLASSGSLVVRVAGFSIPTILADTNGNVGIGISSPHSTLHMSGSLAVNQTIMTATGTIAAHNNVILSSGSVSTTLTLPSAVGIQGRKYTIKRIDDRPNIVTIIEGNGTETIDRSLSTTLHSPGNAVTLISDGNDWLSLERSAAGINTHFGLGSSINQWHSSPATGIALATATLSNGNLRAEPISIGRAVMLEKMAIHVTNAVADTEVRIGVYEDLGGYPGRLIMDVGTGSTSSTGVKTFCSDGCTHTTTVLPRVLQPGFYWMVINSNGEQSIRGFTEGSMISVMGFTSDLPTTPSLGYNVPSPYEELPQHYPADASVTHTTPLPAIFMQFGW